MFRKILPVVAVLALVACAADKNKDLQSAQTNLTSEQAEARYEQDRLAQKQAAERAAVPAHSEERVELDREHAEERAEVRADANKDVAEANRDVASAQAAMQADRAKVEGEAKSRLAKADAKAWEAKNKSAKIRADKRAKFNSTFTGYEKQKQQVELAIGNLSRATNAEWQGTKTQLDQQLDALETAANRLHDDF